MSPPFPGRQIDPGESGDDVRVWQERMKERGWRIDVTGIHDEQSVAVASAFQLEKSLRLDGIVGEETWDGAFNLPVTPGPGGGQRNVTVKLYVNRTGDEIEIGAEVTNVGDGAIPANTLTVIVRVVNPLASPESREYEISRFEVPVIDALGKGQKTYQMSYDTVPLRQDQFRADAWVHDGSTTYDSDSLSFQ